MNFNLPKWSKVALWAALVGAGYTIPSPGAAVEVSSDYPSPNIIVILADDLGFGDVGANNPASDIPTPAMDQLAAEGMRFTDAHSPSAVCTPTRYGLLTGRYAWRSRLKKGVLWGIDPTLIEPGRNTLAHLLQRQGYTTACIGKWHLGMDFRSKSGEVLTHQIKYQNEEGTDVIDYEQRITNSPLTHGFDHSYVIAGSLNMYPYTYIDGDRFAEAATEFQPKTPHAISIISGGPKAPCFDFEKVMDVFTGKAVSFIRKSATQDAPFFLYFPLTGPHKPVIPTDDFKDQSQHGIYGDFVMQMDDTLRQIDEVLEATGTKQNTLVVLTSDNGSFMFRLSDDEPDHLQDFRAVGYHPSNHQSNHIWRGTKADIYEGGHRVPMIVRWPGAVAAGSTSNQTTTLTDWYATLAELVGHPLTEDEAEDSFSLWPLLRESEDWQRAPVIHHSINGTFAIRKGRWKLIAGNGSGGRQQPKGKPFDRPYQLYDMEADPSESTDLIEKHPEIAANLEAALQRINQSGRSRPLN